MSLTVEIIQHTVALAAAHALHETGRDTIAAAREGGARITAWLRQKLTGTDAKSLDDLQTDPADPDNQADLRKRLKQLLQNHPEYEAELRALLPQTTTTTTQTATNINDSTIVQNTGSASINITR